MIHDRHAAARPRQWLALSLVLVLFWGCSDQDSSFAPTDIENPLVLQRADPWVYQAASDVFFFTSTVPEFNRIELRQSASIADLGKATPTVIWRKKASGPMSANIWAPELHRINGSWYIYFSAGSLDRPYDIRLYALKNDAESPMKGKWLEVGQIETQHDTFALDATTFEHRDARYLVWSQKDPEDLQPASLHIARLANPIDITGPEVLIGRPEFDWEKRGIPANQAASIVKHDGRIFIFYTASATDHRSAIGLMWADANADLLQPEAWNKLPNPVLATNEQHNRLGPGHPSVIQLQPSGETIMFYHSREYLDLHGDELEDPNRHTRARQVHWDQDGMPVLRSDLSD